MLQVQKGRDDVMLEFPADDTAGGDHEDALFEMSFHVPKDSDRFGGEETASAAEVSDIFFLQADLPYIVGLFTAFTISCTVCAGSSPSNQSCSLFPGPFMCTVSSCVC